MNPAIQIRYDFGPCPSSPEPAARNIGPGAEAGSPVHDLLAQVEYHFRCAPDADLAGEDGKLSMPARLAVIMGLATLAWIPVLALTAWIAQLQI